MSLIVRDRSKRNRADRENMIQVCKNPIVEDDFHGFLHRNCEGTEQLRILEKSKENVIVKLHFSYKKVFIDNCETHS